MTDPAPTASNTDLQRILLEPAAGQRVVADFLPGEHPAYVYLHGFTSTRDGEKSRALLAHARRRGRACARLDFRGHGESSGQIGSVTLSDWIADAGAAVDRFCPAILVGSSLGGLVAAWLAARRPQGLAGLALLSPALGFLPEAARSGVVTTGEGAVIPLRPEVLADVRSYDESELAGRLQVPLLIVHGELDDVVPVERSVRLFEAVPHADKDLWIVPGGDHRLNRPIAEILARMDALLG